MQLNRFIEEVNKLGIELNNIQLDQLHKYYELLIEWNNKINLTGITEEKEVYLKHFYDSLTISKIIDLNKAKTLCDVGTGAGFPGIVLKIVYPNLKVTLVDSLNKRITFLNEVINELNLTGITTKCYRVEEYAIINREIYDVVTARAVSKLNILLELCAPMVKVNGFFISMKADAEEELKSIDHCMKELNISINEIEKFKLPIENSQRTLISFVKEKQGNIKYPRKFSDIKKKPL